MSWTSKFNELLKKDPNKIGAIPNLPLSKRSFGELDLVQVDKKNEQDIQIIMSKLKKEIDTTTDSSRKKLFTDIFSLIIQMSVEISSNISQNPSDPSKF